MISEVQGLLARLSRRQVLILGSSPGLPAAASAAPASVQLASVWPAARSPTGFLVSEKFDGVRAIWDGQVLRFRSGRVISAPSWFLAALPPLPLDGELWLGRGQFDAVSGAVRRSVPDDAQWRALRFMVFDAWGLQGPFVERVARLKAVLEAAGTPWLVAVSHEAVASAKDLQARLQALVAQGGEGLVLHRADAPWRAGRSEALFKFKPEPDEEGRVVGHQPGQGRLAGQTGALILQTANGQRFALGSGLSDAMRRDPPPVGAWVTYRYRDRTPSGLPRFATFVRVHDLP